MGSTGGGKGGFGNVRDNIDIGRGIGVKGFWIACSCEILEVEPKCNCCGLKGDNISS